MRYDENEKIIMHVLNTIRTPEYDFRDQVRNKMIDKPQFRLSKKKINGILVAAAMLILSATVLASTIPSFNRLLSIISPEMALILQPIDESNKNEVKIETEKFINKVETKNKNTTEIKEAGIEIKPLAVINDDDMMMIYLTLQDLAGDRIDETLSIQDYFVEGATINNCQVIDYNQDNKTAIVQLTTQGGEALNHTIIQIRINSLLTGKKTLERLPINISLKEVIEVTSAGTTLMSRRETQGGGGTGDLWSRLEEYGYIELLKPNKMEITMPEIDVMHITNMGFINGRLHIQTKWEKNNKDSHGYFYLVDKDGSKIEIKENNFYFGVDEKNNIQFGGDYVEYILDVSKEEVKDAQLMGYFVEYGEVIEGGWQLEIDLNSSAEIIKVPCDIQKETWKIKEVSISPLGVTLRGEGDKPNVEALRRSIKMKSGEVKAFDSVHTSNQKGKIVIKFATTIPLNISEIEAIQIDEDIIRLN